MKRKNEETSWHYCQHIDPSDFWEAMQQVYELRGYGALTYKKASELTYWSVSRLTHWFTKGTSREPLSMAIRHHVFLAITHLPKRNLDRGERPLKRELDLLGYQMSSLKDQHRKFSGEVKKQEYWEAFAKEKIRLEDETGYRYRVKRRDTEKGFTLENIYLVKAQSGLVSRKDWDDRSLKK